MQTVSSQRCDDEHNDVVWDKSHSIYYYLMVEKLKTSKTEAKIKVKDSVSILTRLSITKDIEERVAYVTFLNDFKAIKTADKIKMALSADDDRK